MTTITSYNTTNTLTGVSFNFAYQSYTFQQLLALESQNLAAYNYYTNQQVAAGGGTYGYNSSNQFYINTSSYTDYYLGSTSSSGSTVNTIEYINKSTGAIMLATGTFKYSGLPYLSTLISGNITGITEVYPANSAGNENINIFATNVTYQGNGVYSGSVVSAVSGYYNPTTQKGVGLILDGNAPLTVNILTDSVTVGGGGTLTDGGIFAISGPLTNYTVTDSLIASGNASNSLYATPLSQLVIAGSGVTYTLTGSIGYSVTPASSGDTFIIQSPNNQINGVGSGNSVVFNDSSQNYKIIVSGTGSSVVNTNGALGTTSIGNIDSIQFSDQTVQYSWLNGAKSLAQNNSSEFATLTELYLAYFNRAPDAVGLDFWSSGVNSGSTNAQVAQLFSSSPESVNTFGTVSSSASYASISNFVTGVYQNVLNRGPDSGGLSFWSSSIQSGLAAGNLILSFVSSLNAQNGTADKLYFTSKESVGAHFAVTDGLTDTTQAHSVMNTFNSTYTSLGASAAVAAANALSDSYLSGLASHPQLVVQLVGVSV